MNITAITVKNLQRETGCGIVDCKDALVLCEGDEDLAKEFLRYKGCAVLVRDKDGNHVPNEVWALERAKNNLAKRQHRYNCRTETVCQ